MSALQNVLRAFASGALADASACFAEDGSYREAGRPAIRGRALIDAHFQRFAASGRNWQFFVDHVLHDDTRACVEYRFATGGEGEPRRERDGCATVRFGEGGFIAEWREYQG
jgi:ketosteroid isomerase-like protein